MARGDFARFDDDALLGALAVFTKLDRETRKQVQQSTKSTLAPLWTDLLDKRRRYAVGGYEQQDRKLLGKGRVTTTVGGKGSVAAWTGKTLSGRPSAGQTKFTPLTTEQWAFVEFGTRNTRQLPKKTKGGRIAYPAFGGFAHHAARVWLAVLCDTLRTVPGVEDG